MPKDALSVPRAAQLIHGDDRCVPVRGPARPARAADPRARRRVGDDAAGERARGRGLPRRALPRPSARGRRRSRPPQPDPSRRRPRHPPRLPRGGRGHHDDEHVHGHVDRAGGLRPRGRRLRPEPRGRPARAAGLRRAHGRAPLRRRLARAVEPDALALAQGRRPRLPRGHLRLRARELCGAGARPRRRRRRPPPHRDDLRHAEREGRHRRVSRRAGRERHRPAPLDLGHDRRPLRPHALGPDAGGVLGLDRARGSIHRRRQLLAGGEGDPPARGGARAPRRLLHERASERGPSEPLRRLRGGSGDDERAAAGVRRERPRQRRRRLLRNDPRPHDGHRRSSRGAAAARGARAPAR